MTKSNPFWETKSLEQMTRAEWESLCDACGRCCLNKLEDIETGDLVFTKVVCRLFVEESCSCSEYARRSELVPECVVLDKINIRDLIWLPQTCAYRRLAEGKSLQWWHPLVSGTQETVHRAGISIRGRAISELDVDEEDYEEYIVQWVK